MDSKFNILKDYFCGTQGAVSTCGCSSDIKRCCDGMLDEMNNIRENYKSQKYSIEEILKDCVCNRRGHQYCLSEDAIQQAVKNLLNATINDAVDDDNENKGSKLFIKDGKIKGVFCDFEHLYHFIRKTIYPISGIGLLTVYDAAKRIGHLLDTPIYPRQYVYVHAGAKKGAEKLLGKKINGFREPIDSFMPYFPNIGAIIKSTASLPTTDPSLYLEDILCIYKDQL